MSHPLLISLLAEGPKNTGPDFGKASPVGLLIVVLLLIGVFALVWSMNRHLKRIPESFDKPSDTGGPVDPVSGGASAATRPAARSEATRDPEGETTGESGG